MCWEGHGLCFGSRTDRWLSWCCLWAFLTGCIPRCSYRGLPGICTPLRDESNTQARVSPGWVPLLPLVRLTILAIALWCGCWLCSWWSTWVRHMRWGATCMAWAELPGLFEANADWAHCLALEPLALEDILTASRSPSQTRIMKDRAGLLLGQDGPSTAVPAPVPTV